MGEGSTVRVWAVDWLRVGLSFNSFPKLFRVVCNKMSSKEEVGVHIRRSCPGVLSAKSYRELEVLLVAKSSSSHF